MKLDRATGKTEVDLERDEVLLFNNVLNEVCNGFTVPDFQASLGATEDEVCDLLGRIQALPADGPARIQLVDRELLVLQNALREALRELGVKEFSIRTGLPFAYGQATLQELQRWTSR